MLNNVKNYMDKNNMIQFQDQVVVGISGGADSVCLLLVLHELSKTMGFHIHPVHINHNLRGDEAKRDEDFVLDFCKKLGYQCTTYSVDVMAVAKSHGISTEEAGRLVRRKELHKHADKYPQGKVALGHHVDDNVETALFHLCRGTGIRGLAGIKPVVGHIIRPLLGVSRMDIECYLQEQGQEYCVDSTNLECQYTRNKIRNNIIPLLKAEINEKTVERIQDTMLELSEIEAYMEMEVSRAYESLVCNVKGAVEVSEEVVAQLHPVVARSVVKRAMGDMLGGQKDISRNHVKAMVELFDLQVGRKLDLPKGLMAHRTYKGIILSLEGEVESDIHQRCIDLQIPGQTILSDGRVIETEILVYNGQETFQGNDYTKYFDYDIIGDKLFVDIARDTDYFVINKEGNTQSLKKYTKNEKIPQALRKELLCIRDSEEIQWLFDYRVGFKALVGADTKSILKIQIGGEDNGR